MNVSKHSAFSGHLLMIKAVLRLLEQPRPFLGRLVGLPGGLDHQAILADLPVEAPDPAPSLE